MTDTTDGARSPYTSESRAEVLALVPASARRILDVGCNDGTFGTHLLKARPEGEVWGIEPHAGDAEAARTRLTGVVTGTFPDAVSDDLGKFDCISFNHVLEHMVDPWTALRVTRELLTPEGVIVGEIPNARWLPFMFQLAVRGRFEYADSGLLDRTHLRFFTRSSIEDLFDGAGYDLEVLERVVGMGNTRVPRISKIVGKVLGDMAHLAFVFRARPRR